MVTSELKIMGLFAVDFPPLVIAPPRWGGYHASPTGLQKGIDFLWGKAFFFIAALQKMVAELTPQILSSPPLVGGGCFLSLPFIVAILQKPPRGDILDKRKKC